MIARPSNRSILLMLVADLAIMAGALAAQAQTTAGARDDGKAFAAEVAKQAQAAAKQAPTAESVPNFSGSPSQSTLFDDPDTIARAAASAATSHEGYQAVRSSLDRRPRIPVADIEAAIARGQAVADDPMAYVSGMGLGGGQGSCRELPPSTASAGYYEATCNDGLALEQKTESCPITLNVSITRSTKYRYWCSHINAAFNGVDGCVLFENASCETTGWHDGRCLVPVRQPNGRIWCAEPGEPVQELLCSAQVPGATLLGTETQNRITERRDESACAGLSSDAACTASPEVCTSSDPVTRIIDGVAVTRPCWAWDREYQCNRTFPAQDCHELEANQSCSFVREECLTDEIPCPTVERIYRCPMPAGPTGEKQYICDGDIYCIGGECETINRQPNDEFKEAAVALNAAAQAGREFDPENLTLFKGTRDTCRKKVFGLLNCCAGKAFPLLPGASLLVQMGCNREEVLLHQRDAQGLCAYVGSYCSDSVLGVCVTKKKVYCCFESKLSRILQEQGRVQLNKPWAKPKSEQCLGFTVDEFARLDLSRMDFSEVYAEFQDAAKLPEELSTVSAMQQKIADYYTLNGPGQ